MKVWSFFFVSDNEVGNNFSKKKKKLISEHYAAQYVAPKSNINGNICQKRT